MPSRRERWLPVGGAAAVMVSFLLLRAACAEDLVTLSNQRYFNVSAERVDPDGVTYRHSLGMVKLGFEELPLSVRQAYHYDPQRAADFLRAQRERIEENARLVREAEVRRDAAYSRQQAQLAAASGGVPEAGPATVGAFAYSPALSAIGAERARAAAAVVADQIQRRQEAEAKRNDPSVWNERNWKLVPNLVTPLDVRPQNIGREDPFFTPNYSKRAFDDLYHDRGPGVR